METKEDNLYIYLVSSIQGYVFTDDKLKTGSGSCSPVRLILKKDDHKFVEYKEPLDGMELNKSLKELFPEKYYKWLQSIQTLKTY
ncbi:hypothetical protein [Clostridium lundense]|uniref:hypothetical protein n=1 Tax=Clostridium lundense TaxID=319475 RepID=UPI0012EBBD25|nr:hypothetical protein [Clostridium lundense]